MLKIFQKLQAKITDYEKGWTAIGASIITGLSTAIGVTIGGLAVKGITLGLLMIGIYLFANALYWAFLDIGIRMLNWGIGGPFGNMSMTNPANNQIINIGWTLLRDLTNMFFILGLAYIGLATALNFASFNTKKTFTTLILIALLINFTPVICGLVVDGSNIVMNFFLSEVNFSPIGDSYKTLQPLSGITDVSEKTAVDNIIPFTIKGTVVGIYAVIAGFVMTIFGAILLMRHFIIWILVILSPVAFFFRIFDFSKKYFVMWWGWFLSWSFIGVSAAFFLYLANHLMILAKTKQLPSTDPTNQLGVGLTPYFVTVVFMIIALVTTLKIRTIGSGIVMNTANKLATKAKSVPSLVKTKLAAPMGAKAGAIAGVATAGGMAALGTGYKKSRESGQRRVTSALAGARNWARQRGGLTKEGAKEGLKFKEEQRKGMLLGAEKLGIVKPGYYEEERAKRLDTEAETKRLSHLDKDRQEEMLKRYMGKKVKTDADMKVIMALERNKAANQIPLTNDDVKLVSEFGYMDPKAIKEVSKSLPYRAHELDPEKYKKEQQKLIDSGMAIAGIDAETKAKDKMTKDKIQGMSAADFTKYLQVGNLDPTDPVKGLTNITALTNMAQYFSVAQIKDYARKAPAEDKEIMRKFFEPAIFNTLGTPGTPAVPATPGIPGASGFARPGTPAVPATPGTGIFASLSASDTKRLLEVQREVLSNPMFY